MLRVEKHRLTRKFFTLGILIGCLSLASSGVAERESFALGCCTNCDEQLMNCEGACDDQFIPLGPNIPADQYAACLRSCQSQYSRCQETCDPNC